MAMGSAHGLHLSAAFQKIVSDVECESGREWNRRAIKAMALHSCFTRAVQDRFEVTVPTFECLALKSGAKKLLMRWPARRGRTLALADSERARAKVGLRFV